MDVLQGPFEMLMNVSPEEVDFGSQILEIHFYDPELEEWIPLPTEVDPEMHTLMTMTERPGLFGLFERF